MGAAMFEVVWDCMIGGFFVCVIVLCIWLEFSDD